MGDNTILSHALVPVANESDARKTAAQLAEHQPDHVTIAYVVEKGGGSMDKTSVEQSEEIAVDAIAAAQETFPEAESKIVYQTDIVEGIFEATEAVAATAIVYRSRGGNRLLQFLSGDLSLELVTQSPVPVVALPRTE